MQGLWIGTLVVVVVIHCHVLFRLIDEQDLYTKTAKMEIFFSACFWFPELHETFRTLTLVELSPSIVKTVQSNIYLSTEIVFVVAFTSHSSNHTKPTDGYFAVGD